MTAWGMTRDIAERKLRAYWVICERDGYEGSMALGGDFTADEMEAAAAIPELSRAVIAIWRKQGELEERLWRLFRLALEGAEWSHLAPWDPELAEKNPAQRPEGPLCRINTLEDGEPAPLDGAAPPRARDGPLADNCH
jgi:hypothetical protein